MDWDLNENISLYTSCTRKNRLNYSFKNNGLTNDLFTENPRVGSSILSRPTFLNPLKLVTYRHFARLVLTAPFLFFFAGWLRCFHPWISGI